jgi:hypothetical protein
MAQSGRRLTARPAESEHPVTEINCFQEHQSFTGKAKKRPPSKDEGGLSMCKLY